MRLVYTGDCNNEKNLDMNTSDARNQTGALPNKRQVVNRLYYDEVKVHHGGGGYLHPIPAVLAVTVGMKER